MVIGKVNDTSHSVSPLSSMVNQTRRRHSTPGLPSWARVSRICSFEGPTTGPNVYVLILKVMGRERVVRVDRGKVEEGDHRKRPLRNLYGQRFDQECV